MSDTAPETQARAALHALLVSTFGGDHPATVQIKNDRLHPSQGSKGTVVGTSPVRSYPDQHNAQQLDIEILVQFFGRWRKEINPEQSVDPAAAEAFAERFRAALRDGDPDTNGVWFFRLTSLDFPPDPTGNITRFEARVVAVGNNTALLETQA